MSRPFDKARYAALLEGLEIKVLKLSEVRSENEKLRYDSEFFSKTAQLAYEKLRHHRRFGELVEKGYRVVYEATDIISREIGMPEGLPFFLQATDIETPFIRHDRMGCVSCSDWERYDKGRIISGELLIEVKGLAEKVALVTEDTPANTLVSGTCYKMCPKDKLDGPLLIAFLTCRYGQALKNRLKSNLLVSFISKDDLYSLPVPDVGTPFKKAISTTISKSFAADRQAEANISRAELILSEILGLKDWLPPEPLTYTCGSKDVFGTKRLDAEYFLPKYSALQTELASRFKLVTLQTIGEVNKGVTVSYSEDGEVPIIRSGNLTDISDGNRFLCSSDLADIFYLERGDILISSIGFGSIGKVQVFDHDGKFGTVSEVTVIRQSRFNSYYLAAYLRSLAGQMQIERYITGATGQLHLYPKDVAKIFVPFIPEVQQKRFETLARDAATSRAEAKALLARAQRAVEIAIEKGEAAGMKLLET